MACPHPFLPSFLSNKSRTGYVLKVGHEAFVLGHGKRASLNVSAKGVGRGEKWKARKEGEMVVKGVILPFLSNLTVVRARFQQLRS